MVDSHRKLHPILPIQPLVGQERDGHYTRKQQWLIYGRLNSTTPIQLYSPQYVLMKAVYPGWYAFAQICIIKSPALIIVERLLSILNLNFDLHSVSYFHFLFYSFLNYLYEAFP